MAILACALLLANCAWPLPALPPGADASARPERKPDIGYQPTPEGVVVKMLDLAKVTAADTVLDLGSGDGRVPIAAARRYGARGRGIELEPRLVAVARANAAAAGVADRVTFEEGDIFNADLSGVSVVTLFLWPSINDRLAPKLRAELAPGSRVVGYYHDIDGWEPEAVIGGSLLGKIYLWRVPERADAAQPSG
ncbi:SAM-dependent methyltransferase [Sphingomonas japonica]|uniref:SAM-dependent methyltransferase n=1 Tax=Sphingomonas japonica TaxID=511662 RepID=A0ABX0TXY6_9SPHN|nr:class I SAM-dependent methyltransferase [Sphingomonas japonica]NIJ22720.1 SAM-dependent methyltransferase [Sphingomonas japonica]